MSQKKRTTRKKKVKKHIVEGMVYIHATFNNTIITFTDTTGNVVSWSSGGVVGFKGSRKSTPFAAQIAAGDASKKAQAMGMKRVSVMVKGPGPGRESALREIGSSGMMVTLIKDVTPVPHNGCRPRKTRRV